MRDLSATFRRIITTKRNLLPQLYAEVESITTSTCALGNSASNREYFDLHAKATRLRGKLRNTLDVMKDTAQKWQTALEDIEDDGEKDTETEVLVTYFSDNNTENRSITAIEADVEGQLADLDSEMTILDRLLTTSSSTPPLPTGSAALPHTVNGSGGTGTTAQIPLASNTIPLPELPTLTLPTFNGKEYKDFWTVFSDLIDKRDIGDATKLRYLESTLEGKALELFTHLRKRGTSYAAIVSRFQTEYGQDDFAREHLFEQWNALNPDSDSYDDQLDAVNEYETLQYQLKEVDVEMDSNPFFTHEVIKRFPLSSQRVVYKAQQEKNRTLTLTEVLAVLRKYLTAEQYIRRQCLEDSSEEDSSEETSVVMPTIVIVPRWTSQEHVIAKRSNTNSTSNSSRGYRSAAHRRAIRRSKQAAAVVRSISAGFKEPHTTDTTTSKEYRAIRRWQRHEVSMTLSDIVVEKVELSISLPDEISTDREEEAEDLTVVDSVDYISPSLSARETDLAVHDVSEASKGRTDREHALPNRERAPNRDATEEHVVLLEIVREDTEVPTDTGDPHPEAPTARRSKSLATRRNPGWQDSESEDDFYDHITWTFCWIALSNSECDIAVALATLAVLLYLLGQIYFSPDLISTLQFACLQWMAVTAMRLLRRLLCWPFSRRGGRRTPSGRQNRVLLTLSEGHPHTVRGCPVVLKCTSESETRMHSLLEGILLINGIGVIVTVFSLKEREKNL